MTIEEYISKEFSRYYPDMDSFLVQFDHEQSMLVSNETLVFTQTNAGESDAEFFEFRSSNGTLITIPFMEE